MRKLYVRLSDTLLLFCLLATATVLGQTPVQQSDGSWEVILTTSGTWTVPDNVYEITVEAVGGGGGGASTTSTVTSGGGGGGGAYVSSTICVTPATFIPYNIGSGGQGTNNSKHGGDTWFVANSTILAKGGSGTTTATGSVGGSADDSFGDIKYSGVNGDTGDSSISGNGGAAGYTAIIENIGGNTGVGGAGVATSVVGNNGTNYGGGGSGGKRSSALE